MKGAVNMKKSNLALGVLYLIAGLLFGLASWFSAGKLGSLLFGFAGAGIGSGLAMVSRYVYWTRPKNQERYQKKLEHEQVEMQDELKTMLRERSGRYAYVLGIVAVCGSIVAFSVLDALGVVAVPQMMVLYLGGYLVFQIGAGIFMFHRLLRKYE